VSNRDVYLSVTLAWTLAALLGGTPFLVEGTFHSLLDSSFEAMSGFTTTGATLLSGIEAQTPSLLFWRSMTHWLGGIGIVVLFVAEMSGPEHDDVSLDCPTYGARCRS
jgi:trk system potassium uptake protein TrkH